MAIHYNLSKVYEISDNDAEFAQQIIQLFVSEIPNEIRLIKEGIEEKDFDKTYSASHKIKPTLDLMGMDLAYDENLHIMEWTKSQGKKKEIKEVFKSLKEHVDNTLKEIKKDYNL
ncbi:MULTISPECIES: histidine kinase [unclassified Flavobacterium]|uniref:Hpt domain-containing protein n=1 Tax=unclassified Flavobacterium TaxID=196869 RepID=UPI0026360A24|nr:histidine kinase [Flavobacterium sp.]